MKKKAAIIIAVVTLVIIALAVPVWLYGYYNNKSNDNIPNLASIAEMDEADVNKLLAGYRKIQLREIWKEPNETTSTEDMWIINEHTALIVNYNNKDKVAVCKFST